MKRIRNIIAAGGLLIAGSCFANAVFPAGNFTIYGAIKTWGADYFGANDGVTVMAVTTNGTVLASAKVHDAIPCYDEGASYRNYLLKVPLFTPASGKTDVEGDTLSLVIVSATSTYRTADPTAIRVSGAGEKQLVNVELATDDDGDGVADQYVAELAVDMYAYGYDTYDRDADWDEDGQTNYQEYLAGTNPFDETDKFVLTFFSAHGAGKAPTGDYTWPVTFYAKNGRTYYVAGTGSLETNALGRIDWTNETFCVNSQVRKTYTATEDDSPSGDGTTFWLLPVGNQHFWKVLIQVPPSGVVIEKIGDGK